jgi:hypothetical protein
MNLHLLVVLLTPSVLLNILQVFYRKRKITRPTFKRVTVQRSHWSAMVEVEREVTMTLREAVIVVQYYF